MNPVFWENLKKLVIFYFVCGLLLTYVVLEIKGKLPERVKKITGLIIPAIVLMLVIVTTLYLARVVVLVIIVCFPAFVAIILLTHNNEGRDNVSKKIQK